MDSKSDYGVLHELFSFIASDRQDLVLEATKIILSLSKDKSLHYYLQERPESLKLLLQLPAGNVDVAHAAISALINILTPSLLDKEETLDILLTDQFFFDLMRLIVLPQSALADLCCMLLSNLSQRPRICEKIMEMSPGSDTLNVDHLLEVFVRGSEGKYNLNAHFHWLANVFANLASLDQGRKLLLSKRENSKSDEIRFGRIICFLDHSDLHRRGGCISCLKNITFQSDAHHSLLMDTELKFLSAILLPLAGPEDLDEEDMNGLPEDLQLLEPDKTRETDAMFRLYLVETLVLLCKNRACRDILRAKKVYPIVRELDLWEKNEEVKEVIYKLVNLLWADEEKEGAEHVSNGLKVIGSDLPEGVSEFEEV